MLQRILFVTVLAIFAAGSSAYADKSPKGVHKKVKKSMAVESGIQKAADEWNWDKQRIIQEIRDLKYRTTWLKNRQEKNRLYIKNVKQSIVDLEKKKADLNKLREQLEPYLENVIVRMEAFVAKDLPFLPEERQRRIAALKHSLNNYNLPLSEKLRRVFSEGLQIETEYGRMVETTEDQTLNINGIETQVMIFRLGRVGMFYMSLDESQIGRYDMEKRQWEPLQTDLIRSIKRGIDIGQRKRTAEIIDLPLGAL
jgi:hypothetical protein